MLLSALPLAYRLVTRDFTLSHASPALLDLVPLKTGESCCESLGLVHREADCSVARCIRTGMPQQTFRWLGKRYVRIDSFPIRSETGVVTEVVEWFQDDTAVKKLESALVEKQDILETINKAMIEANHHLEDMQEDVRSKNTSLEAANEKLKSLDKLKDEFVNIVSHELKVPLTSIRGSVDLLADELPDSASQRARDLINICQRNILRLQKLVMDLLDVARIESGHLSMQFESFAAANWLADCVDAVRAQAETKHLRIETHVEPGLILDGDRERLLQVVVNLLNNAIKFTDQGQIVATVAASDRSITVKVSDTGRGMSPDIVQTVFEKYQQGGNAGDRAHGFGLGLTIARGIIREHGGTIEAVSREGEGSVFTFTLPRKSPE